MRALAAWPIVLLVVLFPVVFLVARARVGTGVRRRPRRRHLVTRIVCGALGAAIVIAVGVSTYTDVAAIYETEEAARTETVPVPTLDPPPVPTMPQDTRKLVMKDGRFLVHWVFVDRVSSTPVHVETFDFRWRGESQSFERRVELWDHTIDIHFDVFDVAWRRSWRKRDEIVLISSGSLDLSAKGPWGSSSRSVGSDSPLESDYLIEIGWHPYGVSGPLSIVRRPHGTLRIIRLVSRAAVGDPLKEVSLNEFTGLNRERLARHLRRSVQTHWGRHWRSGPADIPGVRMIERFGPLCVLLLAAAVLFAQLFIRRPLAFAGMLVVMVLYVAALDRMVLGEHLSRFTDAKEPVETRMRACRAAVDTFFYAETAQKAFDAVIDDEDTPEGLRNAVKNISAYDPRRQPLPRSRPSDPTQPGAPREYPAPPSPD